MIGFAPHGAAAADLGGYDGGYEERGAAIEGPPVVRRHYDEGPVVAYYGLDASALLRRHDLRVARAVAAWLCRRHSEAPLRELAPRLGLSRASRVPNLTRRLEARLEKCPRLARELAAIMRQVTEQTAAPSGTRTSRLDDQRGESGRAVTPERQKGK